MDLMRSASILKQHKTRGTTPDRRRISPAVRSLLIAGALSLTLAGCKKQDETNRAAAEAPPASPAVVTSGQSGAVHVDQPQQFPLVTATTSQSVTTLNVTGSVAPDVSRELPVLSLANGRVVALHVGLGDIVHKGQLIMEVQSPDISTAFANYLKAVSDERLTKVTLDRDKLLYDKGAISQSQLQIAQNAEEDSLTALTATEQQLRILGVNKDHPGDTVPVYAPASGVIVAQNTTAAGAAGITYGGSTGSFTIADLSHVWVICDVYENDLATVHLGESAQIRLAAYPDKVLTGTISDIGAILDPSIRTAKVRIQVPNPGNILRIGMFATATFHGSSPVQRVVVPANAVLHLHDTAFVFEPAQTSGTFRQVPVKTGALLDGNMMEILSGLSAGQQVVANALELQNTAAQ
jgi:cobalt-zinc-cadmium efflux system membrane fusion protein